MLSCLRQTTATIRGKLRACFQAGALIKICSLVCQRQLYQNHGVPFPLRVRSARERCALPESSLMFWGQRSFDPRLGQFM